MAAALLGPATAAGAAARPLADDLRALADEVSGEWVDATLRRAGGGTTGLFASTRGERRPQRNYGQLMLAYSVLVAAADQPPGRRRDEMAAVAGRALRAASTSRAGAFEQLVTARILADRRTRALLSPAGRRLVTRRIATARRAVVGAKAQACHADAGCYSNLKLVEAIADLELLATGVRGAGGKLDDRAALDGRARATLEQVRGLASGGRATWRSGTEVQQRLAVLSDPPNQPLAYHALSTAAYARATARLRGADRRDAASLLERLATYALGVVAPDGDLTYMGRGQSQAWVQAATLYGAVTAARLLQDRDPARAGELLGLARLNLAVLRERHRQMGSRGGFAIVPEPRSDYRGVDRYASHVIYNGLTLFWLRLASDRAAGISARLPVRPVPSRRGAMRFSDPTGTSLETVRVGRLWIAVHRAATHDVDPRYDWGLLAVKHQRPDGRWVDVIPQRPIQEIVDGRRPPAPRMGPFPVDAAGRPLAAPTITRTTPVAGGVRLTGTVATAAGPQALTWEIRIRDGGVRIAFRPPAGGRWGMLLLRGDGAPAVGGWVPTVRTDHGAWVLPAGTTLRRRPGALHGAARPDLWGTDARWTAAPGALQVVWLRPAVPPGPRSPQAGLGVAATARP